MIKMTLGRRTFVFFNTIFMLLMIVITLYPMLHVLFASVSSPSLLISYRGIMLKPLGFSTEAYKAVVQNPMIGIGYQNTLFVLFGGLIINITMTSLGAYFLSRQNVLWKNTIMGLIVFTMFFSGGLIPFYLTVKSLNLDNTLFALFVPTAINTYNLIIMRTSLQSIPLELEESAKIDGAGHMRILLQIVLPLSMPIIAVMVLYYGVGHWNAWFNAMIFLRNRELFPLQLILREILIFNNTNDMMVGTNTGAGDVEMISETIKYAVIIVSTLPILMLYPFLQRFFVKGVMIGALKG